LIEPDRPTQNAYIESFNGKFRDECLNEHWFETLAQARIEIAVWRRDYNEVRPHSSCNRMPPAKFAALERISQLPKPRQRVVMEVLEAVLAQSSRYCTEQQQLKKNAPASGLPEEVAFYLLKKIRSIGLLLTKCRSVIRFANIFEFFF
jgi:hypothetical protein